MTKIVYFNGALVDAADAAIAIDDGGWLHGAGLFETIRARNGRLFRYDAHVERLRRSAERVLKPIERHALPGEETMRELLRRNELGDARVRLTVSAGPMRGAGSDSESLTICAAASPLVGYPAELYQRGVQVIVSDFRVSPTDPLAGHKTTAYLSRLLALREAGRAHCTEAIWFTTENRLAEGSISNVFVIDGGTLKTPPIDTPVLPGVARGAVLELARAERMEALECPLTIDDLLDADEVILTNVIMQVMPVIRVEKHDIGAGKVGPVAIRLREAYDELVRVESRR